MPRTSAGPVPSPRLPPAAPAAGPASQCLGSLADCGPDFGADDSPVELLVSIQTPFQVEMPLGMVAARRAGEFGCPANAIRGRLDVVGRDQESGPTILDHLAESTP